MLALPVVAAHLWLSTYWPDDRFGWGEGATPPSRIEVAFVRDLQQAPTAAAPTAVPATRVLRAPAPRPAASGVAAMPGDATPSEPSAGRVEVVVPPAQASEPPRELAAVEAQVLPEIAAPADSVAPLSPVAPGAVASADTAATATPAATPPLPTNAAASAVAFEWPPSTRLSYLLTGNYRGPVEGQARVEWRLAGGRYQVSLEVSIGPPFAPLVTRQLQSDGLVTEAGLEPRRYDEETQIVLRAPRRLTVALDPDRVMLANGRQVPRPPGVQDSASQFVQMTWIFTTQPERLKAGAQIELPLALPRHVEVWTYEVVGPERLETPVGPVDTVHVRPRRPPRPGDRGNADLTAEFWVAPSLQYLPVRFVIRQDEETYVDLLLQRLPQQAAAPARK